MTAPPDLAAADAAVVAAWWRTFLATGRLPAELPLAQGRLVRAVHRGELPSGPVFVKAMTFPRAKDRLRYLLRALPAAHEARLLGAVAAAGVPCPAVVAVRTARRGPWPSHSLLVLRALPVAAGTGPAGAARLQAEAALAARLLAAGIVHRDLHGGNFVPLADGRLAVLDLQSASCHGRPRLAADVRLRTAARLLQDRPELPAAAAAAALRAGGLLRDDAEAAAAVAAAKAARAAFAWRRVRRCWEESTEFTRRCHMFGVEHRRRGDLPPGRWLRGGRRLRLAWLGQRVEELFAGRPPRFPALRRNWWWLGGGAALYVPLPSGQPGIEAELERLVAAWERWRRSGGVVGGSVDGKQQSVS